MWLVFRMRFLVDDAKKCSVGQVWIWRAMVLAYLIYAGFCHLTNPDAGDIFGAVTLAIHEFGHLVTSWCSEIVMVSAGSVAQLLAPILVAWYMLSQRDYFGMAVAGSWLSFSTFNLANYIGDARAQVLPLVSLGGDSTPIHDWNYLLSAYNLLPYDLILAQITGVIASTILLVSIGWGAWICWMMATHPAPSKIPVAKW